MACTDGWIECHAGTAAWVGDIVGGASAVAAVFAAIVALRIARHSDERDDRRRRLDEIEKRQAFLAAVDGALALFVGFAERDSEACAESMRRTLLSMVESADVAVRYALGLGVADQDYIGYALTVQANSASNRLEAESMVVNRLNADQVSDIGQIIGEAAADLLKTSEKLIRDDLVKRIAAEPTLVRAMLGDRAAE